MPAAYQHLLAICLVQFAVVVGMRWAAGAKPASLHIFVLLFAMGIPIGLIYDALLGLYGQIFAYPDVSNVPVFLLLNSFFPMAQHCVPLGCCLARALGIRPIARELSDRSSSCY